MNRRTDLVLIAVAAFSILPIAFTASGQTDKEKFSVAVVPATSTGEVSIYISVPRHTSNRGLAIIWADKKGGVGGFEEHLLNGHTDETEYNKDLFNLFDGEYVVHTMLLRMENGEKKVYEQMSFFTVKRDSTSTGKTDTQEDDSRAAVVLFWVANKNLFY